MALPEFPPFPDTFELPMLPPIPRLLPKPHSTLEWEGAHSEGGAWRQAYADEHRGRSAASAALLGGAAGGGAAAAIAIGAAVGALRARRGKAAARVSLRLERASR